MLSQFRRYAFGGAVFVGIITIALVLTSSNVTAQESSAPTNLTVINGAEEGTATLLWDAVESASYYHVRWIARADIDAATSAGTDWQNALVFTVIANVGQSSHNVEGLEPDGLYYFAVGSASERIGEAEWSYWVDLTLSPTACFYTLEEYFEKIQAADRAALIEFYETTDGDNWTDNTNWLSNEPLQNWYGVEIDGFGRVAGLSLSANNLTGTIPESFGSLTELRGIWLDNNDLYGNIPSEFGNLINLTHIQIVKNNIEGSIPSELGNLTNLRRMLLGDNALTGTIPAEFGNLSNIERLDLSWNNIRGSIPMELGDAIKLREVKLQSNRLGGSIPPELGQLIALEHLDLYGNRLTESMPPELGDMIALRFLGLGGNQLSGSIPEELGNLVNLNQLYLNHNNLSGEIPKSLNNIKNWHVWHIIAGNNFTGCIPSGMANAPGAPGDSDRGNLPFCGEETGDGNGGTGGTVNPFN